MMNEQPVLHKDEKAEEEEAEEEEAEEEEAEDDKERRECDLEELCGLALQVNRGQGGERFPQRLLRVQHQGVLPQPRVCNMDTMRIEMMMMMMMMMIMMMM